MLILRGGTGKLKLIGKRRVRRSIAGWLHVNVQLKRSTCQRRRRDAASPGGRQPLVLQLRLTDLDGSAAVDVERLVSAPVECSSTTQLETADRPGNKR